MQMNKEIKMRNEIELMEKKTFEDLKKTFFKIHPINITIEKENDERNDIKKEETFLHDIIFERCYKLEYPIGLICSSFMELTEIVHKNNEKNDNDDEEDEIIVHCFCIYEKNKEKNHHLLQYILFNEEYIVMQCTKNCSFQWHKDCYKKWMLQNYETNINNFNEEGHLYCMTPECGGTIIKSEIWYKGIIQSVHEYKEKNKNKISNFSSKNQIIRKKEKKNINKCKKNIKQNEKKKDKDNNICSQNILLNKIKNDSKQKMNHNKLFIVDDEQKNGENNNNNTFICSLAYPIMKKPSSSKAISLWDFVQPKIEKNNI